MAGAASQAAGAIALLPAAAVAGGAAFATLKVGLSGVGEAFKALSAADKSAISDAAAGAKARQAAASQIRAAQAAVADAEQNAGRVSVESARRIADAQRDLADARAQAGEDAEQAARRVADAERNLQDVQRDALRAQQDLTRAREEAQEQVEDLELAVRGGAIAEKEAILDLKEAQQELDDALRNGGGRRVVFDESRENDAAYMREWQRMLDEGWTSSSSDGMEALYSPTDNDDVQRLILNLEKAKLRVDSVKESNEDLTAEQAEWARTGIEGSRGVQDAQQGVADAQRGIRDAEREVADARSEQAKQAAESARSIQDAQQGVADAQRDAAQAQQDATEQVAEAQARLADAMASSAETASASQQAVAAAMAKLSPAAQDLVERIRSLGPAWDGVRLDVQERLLTGVGSQIVALAGSYLPMLQSSLGGIADGFNRAFGQTTNFLTTPAVIADIAAGMGNVTRALQIASGAVAPLVASFKDLFVVGATFLPGLAGGLADASRNFADFIARARESGQLAAWIQTGIDTLAVLGDILWNVGSIIQSVFSAGAAVGGGFLETIRRATGEVAAFLNSPVGQSQLAGFFTAVAGAVGALSPLLSTVGSIMLGIVGPALANFAELLAPIANELLVALGAALEQIAPVMPQLAEAVGALVRAFLPLIPFLADLVTALLPPFLSLLTLIAPVIPAITAGVLALVAGFKLLSIIHEVKLAWQLLSLAFKASPIGFIITAIVSLVAALVTAYQTSETFRNIVDGAFRAVGAAGLWLWENALRPAWSALLAYWRLVIDGVVWAWTNVLKPSWDAIAAAGMWLWDEVLRPAFSAIGDAWSALVDGIKWAWDNVLSPVWEVLKTAAHILLAVLVVAIFGPILVAWKALTEAMKWAYENILQPAWDALQAAARWLYENVLRPIFAAIGDAWSSLVDAMKWAYENVLQPAWDALQAAARWLHDVVLKPIFDAIGAAWDRVLGAMKWVYDNVLAPMFETFGKAIDALKGAFDTAVNAIGDAWDKIREKAATPINFVIETVLNGGLFKAFNSIIDTLGLDKSWKLKNIDPVRLATGGRVPGSSPTPTADNIPAMLTAGEWVQPVSSVRYYGRQVMEAIRSRQIPREAFQHLATGGLVDLGRRFQSMGATVSRHPAFGGAVRSGHGKNSLHYQDRAIDVNTRPGTSAQEQRELDPLAALARSLGFRTIWRTTDHFNHLHVDDAKGPSLGQTGGEGSGGGGGGIGGLLGGVWGSVTGVFDSLKGSISGPLQDFKSKFGDSTLSRIAGEVPGKMAGMAWDKIKGKVQGMWDSVTDFFGGDGGARSATPPGLGVERWRPTVHAALQRLGLPLSLSGTTLRRMQQESGGNPRAINNWDINAKNGTPSKGLMQVIDPTFAANRDRGLVNDVWDPLANIVASMKYALKRYGSLPAAYDRKGGYALGGLVTPTLFDTGGRLDPGLTLVDNRSRKPEGILTNEQLGWLQSAANGGDRPMTVQVFIGERELTDLVDIRISERDAHDGIHFRSS